MVPSGAAGRPFPKGRPTDARGVNGPGRHARARFRSTAPCAPAACAPAACLRIACRPGPRLPAWAAPAGPRGRPDRARQPAPHSSRSPPCTPSAATASAACPPAPPRSLPDPAAAPCPRPGARPALPPRAGRPPQGARVARRRRRRLRAGRSSGRPPATRRRRPPPRRGPDMGPERVRGAAPPRLGGGASDGRERGSAAQAASAMPGRFRARTRSRISCRAATWLIEKAKPWSRRSSSVSPLRNISRKITRSEKPGTRR
ncbi:hypothetical protein SAMN05216258_103115 [Albimonas pacifica]|uniref:Uncharacterized protein n=1 Tax=Albimonas pacifica TaxID=1114924 RepID=A0A1I3E0F1_9RHOB|nr:hypothetical protein SAMN05216258_103115 [Albimonas pacifica]